MTAQRVLIKTITIIAVLLLLVGCCAPGAFAKHRAIERTDAAAGDTSQNAPDATSTPAETGSVEELSKQQLATLNSLVKVDDYPLYTMRFVGDYPSAVSHDRAKPRQMRSHAPPSSPWACSLFAALADPSERLFGRNFDWEFSPAMLLFTAPSDGYASVSMVDIAYLGFTEATAIGLTDLPVVERRALLDAPSLPFDGMNENGLAVGMAAVPPGSMQPAPNKVTIGSLRVVREMLDHAGDVQQAVDLLQNYNIDFSGGPPLHYLIADASGHAALVEFYQGELVVIPNDKPWHQATNFLRAGAGKSAQGQCWRYDRIADRLAEVDGDIAREDAMALLEDVAQDGTQWSVIYGMSNGELSVAMGRAYKDIFDFIVGPSDR